MKWLWIVCAALVIGRGDLAQAHPHTVPPPVNLTVHILDDEYKIVVTIEKALWRTVSTVPEGGALWDAQRFERWLATVCTIRADEQVLRPQGKTMRALMRLFDPVSNKPSPPTAVAILRQARDEKMPRTVSIEWTNFDNILWEDEIQVPVDIRRGMQSDAALLTPEEPGLVWHTTEHQARVRPELAAAVAQAPPERKPGWRLPVYSFAAVLAGVVLMGLLHRSPAKIRAWVMLVCAGAAVGLYWVGGVQIDYPPPKTLSAKEAEQLFEQLHANIYTAFEVADEDEIFDRLSISAQGPVLDTLYAEVYQSLVLRDENGAVADVESVETTSRDVAFAVDNPNEFDVVWGWNMVGKVTHWGHTHRRKNVYKAEYSVRKSDDVWHIIDMNVLEHARVDLDPEPKPDETSAKPPDAPEDPR